MNRELDPEREREALLFERKARAVTSSILSGLVLGGILLGLLELTNRIVSLWLP